MRQKIMFVDDEQNVLTSLKWLFADEPFDFFGFTNPVEALEVLAQYQFAVVVADQRMKEMVGTDFLEKVRRKHPNTVRIIATAYADMEVTINAINRGNVYRFLFKPWDERELKQTIGNAVSHHELLLENSGLVALLKTQNEELKQVNHHLEKTIEIRTNKIRSHEAERRALENKLTQVQKMEAIGTFAGGIAHDFNNILSAIMGYTELAKLHIGHNERTEGYLNQLEKAEIRAKDLVHQILAFSRQHKSGLIPLKIHGVLHETLKMLRSILPATIEIRKHLSNCGSVMGNETQIHQVVMNLCTNAYHAMEEKGGTLSVTLSETTVGANGSANCPGLRPGRYAKLVVEDTGPGIRGDIIDRIFKPYFTTKTKGKGTGLGLWVANGVIHKMGGAITADGDGRKGARFSVYFPLIDCEIIDRNEPEAPAHGGTERILFVDDEPALVDIGRQILEHFGYEVIALTDSVAALELFRADPDRFDLIVTDMTMPKITGDRLAEQLMEIRNDIPVVICTGFSERISETTAVNMGIRAFAMKPFVRRELAQTVRQVLDRSRTLADPVNSVG